jgi:transcriptional regulator with XRE-family HTH domain
MATFGQILRRLRTAAGLTQAQLAARAKVSPATLQNWEIDHRCPVSADFWSVLKVLGVETAAEFAAARESSKPIRRPRGRPRKPRDAR